MRKIKNPLPKGFTIVETADTTEWFMVLYQGCQWGKEPYDASGCSSQTWATYKDALQAVLTR